MVTIATLPLFLGYFATAAGLLAASVAIYIRITPHDEFALIREGNRAAALSLAGAMIGFSLPLATAIAKSEGFLDMLIWAVISLILQLACFSAMRLVRHDPSGGIAAGDMAEAIVLAASAVVIGLLDAACLT